jgi:hypothetical protein
MALTSASGLGRLEARTLISVFGTLLRVTCEKLQERNALTTVTVPSPNSEPIHALALSYKILIAWCAAGSRKSPAVTPDNALG